LKIECYLEYYQQKSFGMAVRSYFNSKSKTFADGYELVDQCKVYILRALIKLKFVNSTQ